MATVRPAAVAGAFYPADPAALRGTVERLLEQAVPPAIDVHPRILVVPHAGYVYSGSVVAAAYRVLQAAPTRRRVVLLGPSHFIAFRGIATPGADRLATPLGEVPVDRELTSLAESDPMVAPDSAAHAREHSLEVQLPFLRRHRRAERQCRRLRRLRHRAPGVISGRAAPGAGGDPKSRDRPDRTPRHTGCRMSCSTRRRRGGSGPAGTNRAL